MRVSKKKIGRKGANLGGLTMVDPIGVSTVRGCCGVGGLSLGGCWPSEMVVSVCFDRFLVRGRYRHRPALWARLSRNRPDDGQTCDEVPIFAGVDAANRLHTGY